MSVSASPLHFLLFTLTGWINRHQQTVIEYLQEENWILKEQLRDKLLAFKVHTGQSPRAGSLSVLQRCCYQRSADFLRHSRS